MFSMTATAPESIQQRRRLSRENSPRVTPTKNQSPPIPYGQHSPFPVQQKNSRGHTRRYSVGTDATTALVNNCLPPVMPLDGIIGSQETGPGGITIPRGIFRDGAVILSNKAEAEIYIERKCSSMSLEENRQSLQFDTDSAAAPKDNEQHVGNFQLNQTFFAEDDNTKLNASDDDLSEGNEYFDRCKDASTYNNYESPVHPKSPTEQNLLQMDELSNKITDGLAPKYQYKRSPSMEPLFDNATEYRRSKPSFLTLKTVFSTDNGDLGETDGPPEIVPMSPSYEEQTSFYETITRGRDIETSSSTNGVFIDEGEMNGVQTFQRSTSMLPIFDRDSTERLSSADPSAFEDENEHCMGGNVLTSHNAGNPLSPVHEMSPQSTIDARKRLPDPSSPIVYTLSSQPTSPLLSDINTEINQTESDGFGRVCAQLTGVSLSQDSASDIGGDTYFDQSVTDIGGDTYFDINPNDDATKEVKRRCRFDRDDELMQPIALPPRLKRTTTDPEADDQNATLDFPLTPSRGPIIPPSPMRNFDHTHSLLDDCSDEEDDITSFNMVDSPTRHTHSYSCFPKKHASNRSNPYVSYLNFKKQKPNYKQPHPAHTAVDNTIQRALLETRHRRWSCQSAYAGSHAQSDQMFDVSNRVQYITIRENQMNWDYNRNSDLQFIEDDFSDCADDGPVIVLARMSVSHAAIRAGALACGLWRTVRLVRLPKGLFEKHWLMWREKKHSFEEVYDENDVWALLQMLRETFPLLDQVDFGGDTTESSDDAYSDDNVRKEWRLEIISRVLQILPNLIAIDGFDVSGRVPDVPCAPHTESTAEQAKPSYHDIKLEDTNAISVQDAEQAKPSSHDIKLEDTNAICVQDAKSSVGCEVCEPVDMQGCGWSHLVDAQAQSIQEAFSFGVTSAMHGESVEVEPVLSFVAPEQFSVAREISSDAIEDVSQQILSMIEGCVGPAQERKESYTLELDYSPATPLETEDLVDTQDEDTDQMLAPPVPSNSWETINSGSRPPKCPGSSNQRRVPKAPLERKKSKGYNVLKARFKRRVLGLVPSTSVIDDDEDSDGDENENIDECPADLL
ncbi:hypothetical protein ACHAWO_009790 [Cyclotella atomus]|uniref:Uncharacterized protein n=1 Tax=Cyclotella atomus TaxID=382360 RepID=A0ABD3QM78_9STRA